MLEGLRCCDSLRGVDGEAALDEAASYMAYGVSQTTGMKEAEDEPVSETPCQYSTGSNL